MSIEPAAPAFPRSESLLRFFRMTGDAFVPIAEVAELLGTTIEIVQAMLREEGVLPLDGPLPWDDVAARLFDAWPRARIIEALGPEAASLVPRDFQLTRVTWAIPVFILRAIEHQAAEAWRNDPRVQGSVVANPSDARGVEDYIVDLLYNVIDPDTLDAFRDDPSFLRAFHYPAVEDLASSPASSLLPVAASPRWGEGGEAG
jgi:hypothetical protein